MKLFTRGSRAILRIGALGALIITLVLVGCPTTETPAEMPATNLQRRIIPAGILLSWDDPIGGEVDGFNVYNGIDVGALNGDTPLEADVRSYLVTDLSIDSIYAFELEIIFSPSAEGSTDRRVKALVITFVDLPAGSAANPWVVGSAAELRSIVTGFTSSTAANGATAVTRTPAQSLMEHYFQIADNTLCDDATNTTDCTAFVPIGNDYTDSQWYG